jgi:hypothetical protein
MRVTQFPRDPHTGQVRVAMDGTTVSNPVAVGLKLMAISPGDILASLQNGVTALNGLSRQVQTTFPQRGTFSITAPSATGAVARALLREAEEPKDFARPIRYPKLGLA